MSKRHHAKSRRSAAAKWRGGRGAILFSLIALGIVILAVSLNYKKWLPVPDPPEISLTDLDPAIVKVVQQSFGAVVRNPRSGKAWGGLGMTYMVYEYREKAIECFDQAERLNPNEPRWPYFNGILHYPEEADLCLDKMERAVKLFKENSIAPRLRLAAIYAELGRFEEAERHYDQVLRKDPENAIALLGKGKIASANGRLEESVQYLEQSAKSQYAAKQSYTLLSTVYLRLGEGAASRTAQEKAQQLPNDADWPDPFVAEASKFNTGRRAWTDHAEKLVRNNQFQQALPIIQRILKDYPDADDAWQLLGKVRLSEKNYAEAEEAFRNAARYAPRSVESRVQLGVALLYQNRPAEAIQSLQTALEIKPDLAEAYYNLGLSYGMTRDFEDSVKAFRNAIRYKPELIDAYLGAANVYLYQRNTNDARLLLNEAEKINSEDPRLKKMKARLSE